MVVTVYLVVVLPKIPKRRVTKTILLYLLQVLRYNLYPGTTCTRYNLYPGRSMGTGTHTLYMSILSIGTPGTRSNSGICLIYRFCVKVALIDGLH